MHIEPAPDVAGCTTASTTAPQSQPRARYTADSVHPPAAPGRQNRSAVANTILPRPPRHKARPIPPKAGHTVLDTAISIPKQTTDPANTPAPPAHTGTAAVEPETKPSRSSGLVPEAGNTALRTPRRRGCCIQPPEAGSQTSNIPKRSPPPVAPDTARATPPHSPAPTASTPERCYAACFRTAAPHPARAESSSTKITPSRCKAKGLALRT